MSCNIRYRSYRTGTVTPVLKPKKSNRMANTKAYAATAPDSGLAPYAIDRRELRTDDVAIEIDYCGVCHSDLHTVENDWGGSKYPVIPGHEIVGRVTAVGPDVKAYKEGDLVGLLTPVEPALQAGLLVTKRRVIAGSLIGGMPETQEVLDFCAEHDITCDIEMLDIRNINEAYERMKKGDVKYRFVIDMKTLKDS